MSDEIFRMRWSTDAHRKAPKTSQSRLNFQVSLIPQEIRTFIVVLWSKIRSSAVTVVVPLQVIPNTLFTCALLFLVLQNKNYNCIGYCLKSINWGFISYHNSNHNFNFFSIKKIDRRSKNKSTEFSRSGLSVRFVFACLIAHISPSHFSGGTSQIFFFFHSCRHQFVISWTRPDTNMPR